MTLPTPTQIGRYRIEREVGRGGMGVVYEAVDTLLGRTVALKTFAVKPTTPEREREAFERRFLEEARIAATLEHPNVVTVHDLGRDQDTGLLFMALEYVRGETLAEALGRGAMPWPQGCRLIAKAARALHTAHEKNIVHRDVKPANIMVTASGEPKVMDFGIAKASASHLTLVGQIFGTPAYMSPEQGAGEVVDTRSDIFSLGSVLYELVTNAQAFLGDTSGETLRKVLHEEPRPASARTGVPRALDDIISRALRKSREERYQSAVEFADDLDALVDREEAIAAPPPDVQDTRPIARPQPAEVRPPSGDSGSHTITIAPQAAGASEAGHGRSWKRLAFVSIAVLIMAVGGWRFRGQKAERDSQRDARARMAELEAATAALSRDQDIEAWTKLARQAASEKDAATASAALQHLMAESSADLRVKQLARDLNEAFTAPARAAEEEMLTAQALARADAGSMPRPALEEADALAASAGESIANGEFAAATRTFIAATAAYDRVRRSVAPAPEGSSAPGDAAEAAWVFVAGPTKSGDAQTPACACAFEFEVSPKPLRTGAPFRVQILLRNDGVLPVAFDALTVRVVRNGETSTPEIRLHPKSVEQGERVVVAEVPSRASGQLLASEGTNSWFLEVEAGSGGKELVRGRLEMKRPASR